MSPYYMKNAILRCPLFLLPIVSLGIDHSSLSAGPFSRPDPPATRANACSDEECSGPCGIKKTSGHPEGPTAGRLIYTQMSSVELFLCYCGTFSLQHGRASTSNREELSSRQRTSGTACCSCSVESSASEISN